ncbi:MAG: multicopper oxidase domain-containing protein [Dehalococcoidia bacterium]
MKFGLVVAIAAALGAFAVATVALVVAASGSPGGTEAATQVAGKAQTIAVEEGEFFIRPGELHVNAGDSISLTVKNTGTVAHDISMDATHKTALIEPGASGTLNLGKLAVGTYQLKCTVPGHAELGMTTNLMVMEGGSASTTSSSPAAGAKMTAAQMDAEYMAGVKAYPAKTKGTGNQPMTPVVDNGVKVFDLTADETDWETEPGVVRKGMAYNGQIPGPQIRVRLGDRVRIVLHNKLEESTALHFHGLTVPNSMDGVPGITQPLVAPGESFTYEFTVRNAGSNMYHSHMNGAAQIPSGLLGAFIVDGDNEPASDVDQLMVLNDGPLGYTINGKGFPATAPVVAKPGQKVRIRYMNEGLQIHPMHLHGMPQLVIARDGHPVAQPSLEDTVLVAPGQRVDVLIDATEAGIWAFHCHILSHAETEHGMFGMVTAFIVQ